MVANIYAFKKVDSSQLIAPSMYPSYYDEKAIVEDIHKRYVNAVKDILNDPKLNKETREGALALFDSVNIVKIGSFDDAVGLIPSDNIVPLTSVISVYPIIKEMEESNLPNESEVLEDESV